LALRLAAAGHRVVVGSREAGRAETTAAELSQLAGDEVRGLENAAAAAAGDVAILTLPFEGMDQTLRAGAAALRDKLVVSAIVPLRVAGGRPQLLPVAEGSAAQRAAALLPQSRLAAAFHTVSSSHLRKLDLPLEEDVPFAAADADRETIEMLCAAVGARGVWAGGLEVAGWLETLTALIFAVNQRHRANVGVRFSGLP
jgi:NADPH-dependent F420 reductase